MRFLGQLEHGVYIDECDKVPVEAIHKYYGVYRRQAPEIPGQTGAGHPLDEEDEVPTVGNGPEEDQWINIESAHEETAPNIRHDPIPVPRHANPLTDEEIIAFNMALQHYQSNELNLQGYGLHEDEGGEEAFPSIEFPSIELISAGRCGTKQLRISLPIHIWQPRAELWGQSLYILNQILLERGST